VERDADDLAVVDGMGQPVFGRDVVADEKVEPDVVQPPVVDDEAGTDNLAMRADWIASRLDRGEIDRDAHDAELQRLVERADPTLSDPTAVMEVAERIGDDALREWTQAGVLGRYAEAQGFADDELAGFALELGTPAGVDGFLAGLTPQKRATVGTTLNERASAQDDDGAGAGDGVRPYDPDDAEPPAADVEPVDVEPEDTALVVDARRVGAQLERGEMDEAAHDRELQELVARFDPTQEAMDVAGDIRDPDLREWAQAGILGRNANAQDYPDEELARLAVDLATDARIDAFLAGLSPGKRAGVLDVLGERSQWPVAHTTGWTTADRQLFRDAGTVIREFEEGTIDGAAHDAGLRRLAGQADPVMAGWEITHHIRDPATQAETRADLAAAVARAGDQTMAWGMVESIDPDVSDSRGRRIRSRALADLANALDARTAAQEFVDGIDDPATRDEVRDILSEADTLPP
jgi:hypothetical protein